MGMKQRRLAAIVFTDMVGYTSLAQRDETLALQLLEEQRSFVRSALPKFKGREVKTIGDGFLLVFASALQATQFAISLQERLRRRNSSSAAGRSILLRIGIHVGDVVEEGGDLAGDGVNVASRVEPLAQPGGICISRQVYDQVRNKIEPPPVPLGQRELKHLKAPLEVYMVQLRGETQIPHIQPEEKKRVAVLPMANISPEKGDEYFADGMTDELISYLSRIPSIRVIARTSIIRYKTTPKSIFEVGKELGVQAVVEGSVRKAGDRLRITVQLVDAAREEPLWSQEYDRQLSDVFEIQTDVAKRVAASIAPRLGAKVSDTGMEAPANIEAYTLYLRGRYFWNRRTEEDLKRAIDYFDQAVRKDRRYAVAYTGLADSYAVLALLEFLPPNEVYRKAKRAVSKALELAPDMAEAHTSAGLIKFQYDWDWSGAEAEFRRAVELNANYAPAHHFFADYLKAMGRFDEALEQIRLAQEIDPLSLAINTGVGHVLYLSRQYDMAIEQYRRTVELDPNFAQAHIWFGRPYLQKGMNMEAIREIQKAVSLTNRSTISLAMLGHAYASAGKRELALDILDELKQRAKHRYVPSYWLAVIYNGLEDDDLVFSELEKAYRERSSWLAWINVEPRFDRLKNDTRFKTLLKRMRFQ
jgi:adenylate cyclase